MAPDTDDSTTAADDLPLERSSGPSWQDLLDADSRPVPDFLRAESPYLNGLADIPKDRYLSRPPSATASMI